MGRGRSKTVRLAGSHVITTCATIAALLLFVALGSQVLPAAVARLPLTDSGNTLKVAFLLNIAIILFGWRRSKDLREALDAFEAAERQAQRNANTDPGTGLANRRELMRSIADALDSKAGGVFLVLDLDHFKRLNDLHGHLAGDKVLLHVAQVLQKAAPAGACSARTGGDEFALLLPGADESGAEAVGEKIRATLAAPIFVEGSQIQATVSIGLAHLPDSSDEEAALRRSDVALYAAKRGGRNRIAWFDEDLERELTDRLKLEEDIRRGIKTGEFIPYFQPLVDLTSRQIIGFEALARWRSPSWPSPCCCPAGPTSSRPPRASSWRARAACPTGSGARSATASSRCGPSRRCPGPRTSRSRSASAPARGRAASTGTRALRSVHVQLVDGGRWLRVRVEPPAVLVVKGSLGEAFLRFAPNGVWVNASSPTA